MPRSCSMPSRRALAAAVAALLAGPFPARSEDPRMIVHPEKVPTIPVDRTNEEGVLSGKLVESLTARVSSVDLAGRKVTLSGPGGRVETMEAGPEVRNLERLQRGDRVAIRYRVGLVLRQQRPGAEDAEPEVTKKLQRAGQGDVLSGAQTVNARATVSVTSIDAASRVVTLQGAGERTYRVKAGPGIALDQLKVGDRFTATYSAAMALSVEPVYR